MTTSSSKTAAKVVFGAMTIGKPGIEMTRVYTLDDTKALLDTF
jgi:aflatoxin B1 aldehyde reductase